MRLACALSRHDHENLRSYMLGFITRRARPPQHAGKLDWKEIAAACDLNSESLRVAKRVAQHGFEAIIRWLEETEITSANARVTLANDDQQQKNCGLLIGPTAGYGALHSRRMTVPTLNRILDRLC